MGSGVVLYTVDGASLLPVLRGSLPGEGVLTTVDFGAAADVSAAFELQRRCAAGSGRVTHSRGRGRCCAAASQGAGWRCLTHARHAPQVQPPWAVAALLCGVLHGVADPLRRTDGQHEHAAGWGAPGQTRAATSHVCPLPRRACTASPHTLPCALPRPPACRCTRWSTRWPTSWRPAAAPATSTCTWQRAARVSGGAADTA
jgi:hypothetical protein